MYIKRIPTPLLWKDPRYNDEFGEAIKILFDYIDHRNSDIRMFSEQTVDSILRKINALQHLIIDMNTSRVVVVLLAEIKRNGAARSLVFALSRLFHVLKHVKRNRLRTVGIHLVSAVSKILIRPEEAVQSALERYLPSVFTVLGPDFESQRSENIMKLYEVAVDNLELLGVANRTAAVVISQLATYVAVIRRKSFLHFLKILSEASEENRNLLVGIMNSLRLLWPVYLANINEFELEGLQDLIRNSLRTLFSSHSDIIVASLEFLEKVLSSPLNGLRLEHFYPQRPSVMRTGAETVQEIIVPATSYAPSCVSSLRASPVNSIFGQESPTASNFPNSFTHPPFSPHSNTDSGSSESGSKPSSDDGMDVVDPLRHLEISSDFTKYSSSSEESLPVETGTAAASTIPEHLPTEISYESFLTYTAVLLAKRFLLSGHCLKLLADRDVRVSHKIMAMSCLSSLALHLPKFADIPLEAKGGLGVQTMKDLQLYLNHEDDQLKAAAITVLVSAEKCKFRAIGEQFREFHCSFRSFVFDAMRLQRAHCSRALLVALKSASKLVYQTEIAYDVAKFACENYRDNYFLLRVAVVEYLASVEWALASRSSSAHIPDEVFDKYMCLLADDDQRVRNAAAENLPLLTKNANYTLPPNNFAVDRPGDYLCSAFQRKPMTVGMDSHYDFLDQQPIDFVLAGNISVILGKMFDVLTEKADEKQQAGFAAGLCHLMNCYKPIRYPEAWGLKPNADSSRIGLIVSLISKSSCCCTSVQTFVQFLDIATHMAAGLYAVNLMKAANETSKAGAKFPEPFIYDQLLLLQLRILNLYYSLLTDYRQQLALSGLRLSPLSPVRKALPVGASGAASWEQRIAAISTFAGSNIRLSRNTSFLQSASLMHFADSLKGAYLTYMNSIACDVPERFTTLLTCALNCLACILEVLRLQQIADVVEEILLYCRCVVEIAPAESVRVSMQLFKILFGSNVANLSFDAVRTLKLRHTDLPKDLMEVCLLRSANFFTEYVVNTGREEHCQAEITRNDYWANKQKELKEKRIAARAAKQAKKAAEAEAKKKSLEVHFVKGLVLSVENLPKEGCDLAKIKEFFKKYGDAQIRFGGEENGAAKAWEEAVKKGEDGKVMFHGNELKGTVLDGEKEEEYWNNFNKKKADKQERIANNRRAGRGRGRGRGRGGARNSGETRGEKVLYFTLFWEYLLKLLLIYGLAKVFFIYETKSGKD
ncbi:unnamed protein product [Gongylonema pulchrum]|uniref:RRM_3 domain-containing protein n=1 Tax=Gongylonema pulchrum TaxID=637853 RepID=A0A183DPB0_9BILA|nr:unnamed protein product [Gongylonema pulchrum]